MGNIERDKTIRYSFETTRVGENLYNADALKELAEQLPIHEFEVEQLRDAVEEGLYYWIDKNGEKLGPYQIIGDWEAAQKNPAWQDHVDNIKRANLDEPIWIMPDGMVINGMHRLTRALLEKRTTIKVKVFSELPEEAIVKEGIHS